MQPPVKQHLDNIHRVMTQTLLPKLADDPFTAELAGSIAASLALLIEVQPYEDDYLHVELADTRKALAALGAPVSNDTPEGRDALAAAVIEAKDALSQRITALTDANDGTLPDAQRKALSPILDRQLAREASWARLTGFSPNSADLPAIGDLLQQQRSAS